MLLTNLDSTIILRIILGLIAFSVLYFIQALIRHRRFYRNLPKPPGHSFLWGSLAEFGRIVQSLPANSHGQNAMLLLQREHNLPAIFYIDTWPVAEPMLIVTDPNVAAQVTQRNSLPRHTMLKQFLGNLTGSRSIFDTNGHEWKELRSMFNPGFSSTHLFTLVPGIAEHVLGFREKLRSHAQKQDIFPLLDIATNLTIDVIGEVVLGQNFNAQREVDNPVPITFKKAVASTWNHMDIIGKAIKMPMRWWYCRRLDIFLGQAIRKRYENAQFKDRTAVVDLALEAYNSDKFGSSTKTDSGRIDDDFMEVAVQNVKTFILGGHDTSASTAAYCFYNLAKHPDILKEIRMELDTVFDPDNNKTLELLRRDPRLLNSLVLTNAVIKETLRLFPPAASMRESKKGHTINYNGTEFPTHGHGILIVHFGMHRSATLFPNPDLFLPQRFLPSNHPLATSSLNETTIPRDAFRPFEKGPRNCIGQELAMMELKIILLLTVREFDFEISYGQGPAAPPELAGRAYQMFLFSPKPNEGMPVRVKERIM